MSTKVVLRHLLVLVVLTATTGLASADNELNWFDSLTSYERDHVERAATGRGLEPISAKTGTRIDFVTLHRYPVFVDFESIPQFPNYIHILTKKRVIKREVLLEKGTPYQPDLVAESVRNLRGLGVFSLVAATPVRDAKTTRIGLLIVTRDLWSLRLESRFQFTGGHVDRVTAQLTERNLLGRGRLVSARFAMDSFTQSTGGLYVDPRVSGQRYYLTASADAVFRREDHRYDGFKTFLSFGRPFYNLAQRWGFTAWVQYQQMGGRHTRQGQLLAYDDPETDDTEFIPRLWHSESVGSEVSASYQAGRRWIFRSSLGLGVLHYVAETVPESGLNGYSLDTQRQFEADVVPEDQRWIYPLVSASLFTNRYRTYRNLAGYALSEDVQLGLSSAIRLRSPLKALGSSVNVLLLGSHLVYRSAYWADGLLEVAGGWQSRYRPDESSLRDRAYLVRARIASPYLGFGRFVNRNDWIMYDDSVRAYPLTLGGHNGLRGYASQQFLSFGGRRIRSNVEFRSAPVRFFTARGGLVGFYDAGVLYGGSLETGLRQSVGIGLRMVIPQASRFTYRFDFGVPVDGTGFMLTLSGETNQATPMTPVEDGLSNETISVGGLVNQP